MPPLLYSKAVVRLMPYAAQLPDIDRSNPTLVMHTNGGGTDNGSLFGWFARAGNDVCAHFQVMLDGTVEQYVPLNKQAYAQYTGNRIAWSVEHEDGGDPNTPLTPAQLAADADLISELGVPAQVTSITGPGVGWHSLYAEWNQSGHNCVGPVREAQYRALIASLNAPPTTPSLEGDTVLVIRASGRPAAVLTPNNDGKPLARYLSSSEWQALYRLSVAAPDDVKVVMRPAAEHDALTGGQK